MDLRVVVRAVGDWPKARPGPSPAAYRCAAGPARR